MNIFRNFFSLFNSKKENGIINEKEEKQNILKLPYELYLEFIDYVKNRYDDDIDRISKFEYTEKIGSFQKLLKEAIDNGDLKYADNYEKLLLLKIPELKEILKLYELKTSGKKDELIKRIKENILEKDLIKLLPAKPAIVLTEKTKILLSEYKNNNKNKIRKLEEETINLIYTTFDKKIVDDNFNKYIFYNRNDLFKKESNIENINKLELWENYFKVISKVELKDLKNSDEFKKRMKAIIIYCAVYNGFLRFSLSSKIIEFLDEEILNPHLDEVLLKIGYCNEKLTNKFRLERYIRYYIFLVLRQENLNSLKEAGIKKIGILKYSDECYLHTGKEVYNLETDIVPELPSDYCCDCEYMML